LKRNTKFFGLLIGAVLFSYLVFNFLSGKGSSDPMPVLASAQDRASTILKRAQQAKEDIFILAKSDPLGKETTKEEEKPAVDEPAAVFPIYGNLWGKEEIPELRDFSKWADEYTKFPQRTQQRIDQGVELAKVRREIMRDLIEMDPEAALASSSPRDVREQLPRAVLNHSERHINGIGDMDVQVVTPEAGSEFNGSRIERFVRLHGGTYQAHVFGQMRGFGSVNEFYLHGVSISGHLALSDTPMRPMELGEPLVAGKNVQAGHPVSRNIANLLRGERVGPFFAEGKEGYNCLCCGAAQWDDYGAYLSEVAASGGPPVAAAIGRAYNNTGAKKLLLIPVEFPDKIGSPWSSTTVRDSRITEIKDYFSTASYGVFSLPTVDVAPLQLMDNNSTSYPRTDAGLVDLKDHATTKATAAGYDEADYEFVHIVLNHNAWAEAGLGEVGGKFSGIDGTRGGTEQDQITGIYIHELGHNLGLWHANGWDSETPTPDDANGSLEEYYYLFDHMGFSGTHDYDQMHFNASFKNALDWLPDSYVTTLSDGDADTPVNLYAMDQTQVSGRTYAVKLDTGVSLGSNTDLDYWIEFRSRYPANSTLDDGVLVYLSNDAHDQYALKLLDMNPVTSTFNDAGLDMSESFSIAGGRWKITVNSQSGSGADSYLTVSFEDVRAPAITTQPADTSAKYGTSVTLSVSATGPGLMSYQWHMDGTALSGETNSTLTISDFQEPNKGDYHVVITNSFGTATSSTATLSESTGGGGGGSGGGCGSMPPVNLMVIGWFGLLFSRLFLWFNFGVNRTSASTSTPKTKKAGGIIA
jgi:hypothetical protein